MVDLGRYFDGAVRRVVAEWRTPNGGAGTPRKVELECGHLQTLNSRIPSTLASSIKQPATTTEAVPLIRLPVEAGRAARVCSECRDAYVRRRLHGEIRYIGEERT